VIAPADDVVVLVDNDDRTLGTAPKLDAHHEGLLHRAVSVMLFDDLGRVLLQRRASTKYHSSGLWSNTCCGHPQPRESVLDAAGRRLRAELGIEGAALTHVGSFVYRSDLPGGLVEHELDHVFVGRWTGEPAPNPDEVAAWEWASPESVRAQLALTPDRYTVWLPHLFDHLRRSLDGTAEPTAAAGSGDI
jgi:isopentenyl-diphosphate delta-isomerase